MAAPGDETLPFDRIAVAETRPALPFGVPWAWLVPTLFGPPILAVFTLLADHFSPSVLVLWPVMYFLGRAAVAADPLRPRIMWLWIMSGAALADRSRYGGDSPPALPPSDRWFGNYHG
jgi:type IV secretory pathway VirB3-like protein